MNPGPWKIPAVLLAALAAAARSGAEPPAHAAEARRLVYALPVSVPTALPYLALDEGYFRTEGLDVEARMFSSGREALEALLAGQAQVQTVSETPVVHAIVQGNELVTVATVARHAEAKLLARRDRGIRRPEDLVGKRVATLPGTNSDFFMYAFFGKYGIPKDRVRIANMSPPDMVVAYVKGDIDAYFAWEPHIYFGKRQLPRQSVEFYPGDLYRGWATVNMQPEFLRRNPDVARRVLRALLKAEAFARAHPRDAMDSVARRLHMDRDALESLWKENTYKVELDRGLLRTEEKIGRWSMEESGKTGPPPDFRKYVDPGPLEKERPSAVRL